MGLYLYRCDHVQEGRWILRSGLVIQTGNLNACYFCRSQVNVVKGIDDGRRALGAGKQMVILSKVGKKKTILRVWSKCSDRKLGCKLITFSTCNTAFVNKRVHNAFLP